MEPTTNPATPGVPGPPASIPSPVQAPPSPHQTARPQPINPALRGHGEVVLVIDDEEPIRVISRRALEAFGYRALVAASGEEAISVFEDHASEVRLILTDMGMPGMDGPATIQALLKLNPDLRVVAMSGYSVEDQLGGFKLPSQVCGLLEKPYTTETLLHAVRRALADASLPR